MTGNSEGKGSALCVGNIILNMQRDAKGDLEGVSMIFRMQVEPGAVAVVPGPIGRMQAKGPALPNAKQLPAPLNSGVQICVNFIVMTVELQGLQCKIVSLLPLPSFSSFSSPSLLPFFFLLPHPSCLLLLRSTNTKKKPGGAARRCPWIFKNYFC